MINWLEEFEKFLLENNCYSEFVTELLDTGRTLSEYVKHRLEKEKEGWLIQNFVIGAFIWDSRFNWNPIHEKWFTYVCDRLGE